MTFLFWVFVGLLVLALLYQKNEPVLLKGERRTRVKPGVIAFLGIGAFVLFLAMMSGGNEKASKTQPAKIQQGDTPRFNWVYDPNKK